MARNRNRDQENGLQGRPRHLKGSGGLKFVTFAMRESEKKVLEDWAWRTRTRTSTLVRGFVMEGLKRLEATPNKESLWPLPFSPQDEGASLSVVEAFTAAEE